MAAAGSGLDVRSVGLASTSFGGQRLRRQQLADIQEIVTSLPRLSRTELGHTVCEYLGWQTPRGSNRIQLAMRLLEELERLSILALPARQRPGRGRQAPLQLRPHSAPQAQLEGPLPQFEPLRLRLVSDRTEAGLWNEFLERYHPLGCRQPIGCPPRYFLEDRQQRLLGCLLYDSAARYLPLRDRWIGWQDQPRRAMERVVRQAPFLVFPCVRVKCLVSKALGLSLRQLAADWQHQHGVRPCWRRRMSARPTPAPATGPRPGTIWDKPKPAVPWVPCPPRRPMPSSWIRYSATGRRFCSYPNARPAPARRPPPWTAHERLSRPLAPRLLNAYIRSQSPLLCPVIRR